MNDNFDRIIAIIFKREGGYMNDPNDSGGETNYGISKRAFPKEDIKNLTKERAKELYRTTYWNPLNLHLLNSGLLALHVFDMAVNAGRKTAVRMLQRVVGSHPDGILGNVTAKCANNKVGVVQAYIEAREQHYKDIATKRPKNKKYLNGWMNRVRLVTEDYEKTFVA